MAATASRMVRDQNLNVHSTGPYSSMLDGSKTTKKGAITGRKALNDISNSSKLSAHASREPSSKFVISKGKDIGTPGTALGVSSDKAYNSKASVKGQLSGRKALGDLTNTNFVRSSTTQNGPKKKVQGRKFSGIAEDITPSAIKEEQFSHNHEECIKTQKKSTHLKYFLENVGLCSPLLVPQAPKLQVASPKKGMDTKEMLDIIMEEDQTWIAEFSVYSSPARDSPRSMTMPTHENWKNAYETIEFKLIESPKPHTAAQDISDLHCY